MWGPVSVSVSKLCLWIHLSFLTGRSHCPGCFTVQCIHVGNCISLYPSSILSFSISFHVPSLISYSTQTDFSITVINFNAQFFPCKLSPLRRQSWLLLIAFSSSLLYLSYQYWCIFQSGTDQSHYQFHHIFIHVVESQSYIYQQPMGLFNYLILMFSMTNHHTQGYGLMPTSMVDAQLANDGTKLTAIWTFWCWCECRKVLIEWHKTPTLSSSEAINSLLIVLPGNIFITTTNSVIITFITIITITVLTTTNKFFSVVDEPGTTEQFILCGL